MENVKIEARNYSWGKLIVLRKGNSLTVVIHPEHHEEVKNFGTFTDEQSITWEVIDKQDFIQFKSKHGTVNIKTELLNQALS